MTALQGAPFLTPVSATRATDGQRPIPKIFDHLPRPGPTVSGGRDWGHTRKSSLQLARDREDASIRETGHLLIKRAASLVSKDEGGDSVKPDVRVP
ncbi:hypothetical protein PT974_10436 [Cladobotryum mycophilum]|uniref:Uncharacterized protein n=1 Tax=Cladobotryum mycophilum TaxID=491253 RepID=A0ABR0S9V3_9HYPO